MGLFGKNKIGNGLSLREVKKLTEAYTEAVYLIAETDTTKQYFRAVVGQDVIDAYNNAQQTQAAIANKLIAADPGFREQLEALNDDIYNSVEDMLRKEYGEKPEPDPDYIIEMQEKHPDVMRDMTICGVASLGMMSKAKTAREEGDQESADKLDYLSARAMDDMLDIGDSISLHVNEIQLYVQDIYNGFIDDESFDTIDDVMKVYIHKFYKE